MEKRVILTLMEGSFEHGFPVILRISEDNAPAETGIQVSGKLPPAPYIPEVFKNWQSAYRQLVMPHARIKPKPAQVTNVSCHQLGDRLAEYLNEWLNSGTKEWQKIRDGLQHFLSDTDEIQFIIQSNDIQLRQLPWNLWNFFENYPKAEFALSASEYQSPKKALTKNSSSKVRILAILGNSEGIDIEKDRAFLEQLSNQAETKFLVEPQPEKLNDHLWEQGWDILFFAGHSSSQEKGRIQLNQTDSLSLNQLRYALNKAIKQGLRLAIFNSCDGLGLAQQLTDLHIGQVIVMREPIPDVVAEEFLRHFLKAFSSGQSLYASVRFARERLERLESKFPCATWLPVICTNPAEAPMTWPLPQRPIFSLHSLRTVLIVSFVVTILVMGLRHQGFLQASELQAFDHLMQLRPAEKPDPRLLIVTVDEGDIQYQIQMGMKMRWSLSDQALIQLLKKLDQLQPKTIGIDIYRDFPVDPNYADLATRLKQDNRLFAVCKVPAPEDDVPEGNNPPPEVPKERVGFSDFVADDDDIVRRQLLHMRPPITSPCATQYAFSLQLALRYLDSQGIKSDVTPKGYLQIGGVVFKPLKAHSSGYQGVNASGYQVLLNYRALSSPKNIAQTISLRDVLSDRINPELVESLKHRIVLIGVTAITTADTWKTPYSTGARPQQKQLPGVFVQAQMVSHILSTALDHRPLLWWWSEWIEALWVWGWSLVGGIIAWCIRKPLYLGLVGGIALLTLFGLCFAVFTQAGWVPLIPSALTLIATQVAIVWWLIAHPHFANSRRHLDSHS
jgi:CHASE2 domain-containing sensor protein